MIHFKVTRNPYLLFSPLLLFFIVLVLLFYTDALEGDEWRYLFFAQNLINGFYSPPAPDINLWNGPGYPIILIPFVALQLPYICIALLNAVFQYLSIVLMFKAMMQLISFRKTLLFCLFWAFCYSSYIYMPAIHTETLTIFLVSLMVLFFVKGFNGRVNKYTYLSGFVLGYLALTKIIIGYVVLFLLIGSTLLWMTNRTDNNYRKSILIVILAFATTLPYLIYTYSLTGKFYYWGNAGGMSLYWMSTPYEKEYGEWNNESFTGNWIDADIPGATSHATSLLKLNHKKDIDEVLKYKGVEKDGAYKKIAINNIKNHPTKYIKNIIANISRLFFDFPGNYTYQRPLLKIWYFSIVYTLMLFSLILTLINWKEIEYCIRFLFVFAFIYLGLSSLVSAGNRQFIVILPILLCWVAYIIQNLIRINIKMGKYT